MKMNKPYDDWVWSDAVGQWIPPVPFPESMYQEGHFYKFDQATHSWVEETGKQ
jgi:hypothetical protein